MKRLNFNIKDRKVLTLGLCLILVCAFTLTIAYAALNAVLTISGSAQVTSADWDIHLANPDVTSGSVSDVKPVISNPITATFSVTLNMPGDFYEFTIDVVNAGDIDAMIENITKTPTLSSEQAKYLKYEITYQNGGAITAKQLVEKNSFVRLKVRVEYRSDISSTDLPTTSETLNLGLKLDYIQSDGSGNVVGGGGVPVSIVADGDINNKGTIVTIGTEQFYVLSGDENNVNLLSMYNLYVGGKYENDVYTAYGDEATGIQDSSMIGSLGMMSSVSYGVTSFYTDEQIENNDFSYENSLVKRYLDDYNNYLTSLGVNIVNIELLNGNVLISNGCSYGNCDCLFAPSFLRSTSYWAIDSSDSSVLWGVFATGYFDYDIYYDDYRYLLGVRPVIVISKDYFN